MEYRERLGPEGFLDCLDCQDLVVAVVLRETEDLMETLDVLVWGWRVPWVPRVLMAHRAPQELGSLDLRVLEVLLENKVRCFFQRIVCLQVYSLHICMNQRMALRHLFLIWRVSGVSGLQGPQGWPGKPGSCDMRQCQELVRNVEIIPFQDNQEDADWKQRRLERKRRKKEKRGKRRKRKKRKKNKSETYF